MNLNLKDIRIDDAFWGARQQMIRDVAIPYQEDVLNDRVPGVEKSHAIANFRIAAGLEEGDFYGFVFQDSDVAKWLEAVAYSLALYPDPELEKRADEVIAVIEAAQEEDGYLDTYFTVKAPEKKWTNVYECHELYCAGHMMEAAVAYYEATGKDRLLTVMRKTADLIDSKFGPGKDLRVPGHEEVEIGLMKLYRATGEERYARLAKHFVDERGVDPDVFAREREKRGWSHFGMDPVNGKEYTQSHAPVREQTEAVGHSVRAVYLYTAMADIAAHTGDETLVRACERLWNNITQKRMFITGGIGSTPDGEAFTLDYDLPNDSCYTETCAAIGLIFFARKMLDIHPHGEYADIMERALYNNVLSGMQLDGTRFFYVNPLEVNPGISGKLFGYKHVLPERPGWHSCACCPPNEVRMIMSLGQYAWGVKENTVYSHLFMGGSVDTEFAKISALSEYPWNGYVKYEVSAVKESDFSLAIHIPAHAEGISVMLNGSEVKVELTDGYLIFKRNWSEGDSIEIRFEMPVRRIFANSKVRADAGCAALMRGPFVYCLEGVDNGKDLMELRIPEDAVIRTVDEEAEELKGMVALEFDGIRVRSGEALYSTLRPEKLPQKIHAIPYFAWGNRGLTEMRVWIPEI